MLFQWFDVFQASLQGIYLGIASFVPMLLAALVVAILGWFVGSVCYKFVSQLVKLARVDSALRAVGLESVVERAGFKLDSGMFLGKLVEWFVVIVFLVASLDILGLVQVTSFLRDTVLGYLPQVIAAAFIILAAAVLAETMEKIVVSSAKAANIKSANFAGKVTKWAIWIFAVLVAVSQLGIAVQFITTLFQGVIIALSLALGLSFGLGGQQAAADYIAKVKNDIR